MHGDGASIMSSGCCDNVIIFIRMTVDNFASIRKIIAIVNRIHAQYVCVCVRESECTLA